MERAPAAAAIAGSLAAIAINPSARHAARRVAGA
jgi:hypothetical protein